MLERNSGQRTDRGSIDKPNRSILNISIINPSGSSFSQQRMTSRRKYRHLPVRNRGETGEMPPLRRRHGILDAAVRRRTENVRDRRHRSAGNNSRLARPHVWRHRRHAASYPSLAGLQTATTGFDFRETIRRARGWRGDERKREMLIRPDTNDGQVDWRVYSSTTGPFCAKPRDRRRHAVWRHGVESTAVNIERSLPRMGYSRAAATGSPNRLKPPADHARCRRHLATADLFDATPWR